MLHAPHESAASSQKGHISAPPPHVPSLQRSPSVQKRPSSHPATLGTCSQLETPQRSSVQGLPSLQAVGSQVEPSGRLTSSSGGASLSMMGLRWSEQATRGSTEIAK